MAKTTTKKKAATKAPQKAPAKRKWLVVPVPVAGKYLYSVYKLRDESKPDEDGNREMHGGLWQTKKEAENLAKLWNEEGKK